MRRPRLCCGRSIWATCRALWCRLGSSRHGRTTRSGTELSHRPRRVIAARIVDRQSSILHIHDVKRRSRVDAPIITLGFGWILAFYALLTVNGPVRARDRLRSPRRSCVSVMYHEALLFRSITCVVAKHLRE